MSVHVQFHPNVHPFSPSVSHLQENIEVSRDQSIFNENKPWVAGEEFFLNTQLFRGKGLLYSRGTENFPADPRYQSKRMVIRMVGQVKCAISMKEMFMGGIFHQGIRGLPKEWILKFGLRVARSKTPHFFLNFSPTTPYIAVPVFPLIDDLHIFGMSGRSLEAWVHYNLQVPIEENWTSEISQEILDSCDIHRDSPPNQQRECRHRLRWTDPNEWPVFKIYPHQIFAFEISDAALLFEDFRVQWKVANVLPITLDLKRHIYELPFSVFLLHDQKRETPCPHDGEDPYPNTIPKAWRNQSLCAKCFPPNETKSPHQFLFALSVLHK
jgi:hypothetical protein